MREYMNSLTDEPATKLTLLLLDDEQDIINSLKRVLRKDYDIVTFTDGPLALEYLENNHIDIIISDMRMPVMDGAEFFTLSRENQPHAIRILLTGYSDIDTTIKAINDGGIYTYIGKPWENQELKLLLDKASEHYLLKKETRELNKKLSDANEQLAKFNHSLELQVSQRTNALEQSKDKLSATVKTQNVLLHDMIDMMSTTIEYRTGFGTGHNKRIALQCKAVARHLELDDATCRRTYLSALLHEIGIIGLKDDVLSSLDFGTGKLDEEFNRHPVIGAEIVGRVHRLASLTDNILHQNENMDGTGFPDHLAGDDIPLGSRIIRVVKDFDFLIAGKENNKRMGIKEAQAWLMSRADVWYDKTIISVLFTVLTQHQQTDEDMEFSVGIEGLKVGDKLMEDLVLTNGNIMLTAGQEISKSMIEKLKIYEENYNTKVTLFIV